MAKSKRESHGAILIVAQGTTMSEGRTVVTRCMDLMKNRYPKAVVRFSYTSDIVREVLSGSGERVRGPVAEITDLTDEGYTKILLQPICITPGSWYQDLHRMVLLMNTMKEPHYKTGLNGLIISRPLLMLEEDFWESAKAIVNRYADYLQNSVVVLISPQAERDCNSTLCKLQMIFDELSNGRILIGSMTGFPGMDYITKRLSYTGVHSLLLSPLTLLPGIHSWIDIIGENGTDSWKKTLESEGYEVLSDNSVLGESEEILTLFADRAAAIIKKHRFFAQ